MSIENPTSVRKMQTIDQIAEEVVNLPRRWHTAGTISSHVIHYLSKCTDGMDVKNSIETGSGKSTLIISNLSRSHKVFSLDDHETVSKVRESPLARQEVIEFILGPTQKTLPAYNFPNTLQLAMIDGPHGYPFPDLEYYYIYPHLEPGAILVIDDIQIPTVANLFRFLADDEMFQLAKVVDTTAFFKRTDAPVFDPFADGWWLQQYNARRVPVLHSLKDQIGYLMNLHHRLPESIRTRAKSFLGRR